jgi:hypothetical protein
MFPEAATPEQDEDISFSSESVAVTPAPEPLPPRVDPTQPPSIDEAERPADLSSQGTFQSRRRNFHPDFAPGGRAGQSNAADGLKILRNYHPEFAPGTVSDQHAGPDGAIPPPAEPESGEPRELDLEMDPDEPAEAESDTWDDDGEFDFLEKNDLR